jgi:hypothetical protein
VRVVGSHHEGEWRHTPPRSKEGRTLSQRPARNQMSDIPPAPAKSPILIIVLLAVVVAVLAAIWYIAAQW